jgi:mono/diheme cytochrome c family protein
LRAALATALGLAALVPASARAGSDPQIDYMLQCQGCHAPDGSGAQGAVPDLRGSLALFPLVTGGREYLIRVPGSAQSPLGDAELAALLNWMIRRFGPAAAAREVEPFTAAEVARHRRPPLLDVGELRRELLRRIGARASAAPGS